MHCLDVHRFLLLLLGLPLDPEGLLLHACQIVEWLSLGNNLFAPAAVVVHAVEFERPGKLNLAATPWQAKGLKSLAESSARFGVETQYLEGAALAPPDGTFLEGIL